jgi:hypothetical protein
MLSYSCQASFFGGGFGPEFPPGAKTFGLTRFTVTPKDFAPTRFERDRSGVAILRNTGAISPNRNPASVAWGWTRSAMCRLTSRAQARGADESGCLNLNIRESG